MKVQYQPPECYKYINMAEIDITLKSQLRAQSNTPITLFFTPCPTSIQMNFDTIKQLLEAPYRIF